MKLRFRANNVDYELDGSVTELSEFVRAAIKIEQTSNALPKSIDRIQLRRSMPSTIDVVNFIQSLNEPDMRHTIPEITEHFLGVVLDTRKDILLYNQIFERTQRARRIIEIKTHRKFFGIREPSVNGRAKGNVMVYRLEPETTETALKSFSTGYVPPLMTTTPATRGVKVIR